MPELELALVELGQSIDYPATPNLAGGVRERLAERARPRRRPVLQRRLVLALAVLAVAVGALMAVPGTRAAILELFGLRGVTIERVGTLPTVPTQADLLLGERVTLAEARERAAFEVRVPDALGEPDEVYFRSDPPGGMVSFVYGSSAAPRALLTQFRAGVRDAIFKKGIAETDIERVRITGQPGFWLSGAPHVFGYFDAQGEFREETLRLVGNTLLWERGLLTFRLEADISKGKALLIARSIP
jgi:hypothetical protein